MSSHDFEHFLERAINEREMARAAIAETERILDELDGKNDD